MKIDLETYLHVICNDWAFATSRYSLELPFVYDGWKIATDGRIMLATPTDEPNTPADVGSNKRLPQGQQLGPVLDGLQADWGDARQPWPEIGSYKAIEPLEHEDDDKYLIVMDWDREVVVDARYYWMVERLAIACERRVEVRYPELEFDAMYYCRHAIQFRSDFRDAQGRCMFFGQIMPFDATRAPSAAHALKLYKQSKKASEEA